MKHIVVGTAGHIDHGKSTLVLALTGIDPDRLKEEKERGITIELGFAFAAIDDTTVAFVDVPGHERFVKTMLAGVGGIDCVMLIVAADESVMPQTREHFDICRLLSWTTTPLSWCVSRYVISSKDHSSTLRQLFPCPRAQAQGSTSSAASWLGSPPT
jgi:translation initiation factor 2 gamma subunit (eIF-2gamma)